MVLVIIVLCVLCSTSCAGTPEQLSSEQSGTILVLPTKEELSTKEYDPLIKSYMEIGSPAGIRMAITRLYDTIQGMTKVKVRDTAFASRLMQFLYPLEPLQWQPIRFNEPNVYLDALTKVEQGIYPAELGTNSFWETIIPTFILVKGSGIHEYSSIIENRLSHAQTLNADSVLPPYLLGLLYEYTHRLSEAETAYQTAWQRDNSCYPAGIQYVQILLLRNKAAKAFETAAALYDRYPKSMRIQILFADAAIEAGNRQQAEPIVQELLQQENSLQEALFLKVRIYIEKKEYIPALTLLDGYAKKNKTEKKYLLLRARIFSEWSKNTGEAKRYLEKAEQLYPQSLDVLLACAQLCFNTNDTINGKTVNDFIHSLLAQDNENSAALKILVQQDIMQERWEYAFKRAEYLYTLVPSEEHRLLYIQTCIGIKNWHYAAAAAQEAYMQTDKPSDAITAFYLEALYGKNDYAAMHTVIQKKLAGARSGLKAVLYYYQAVLENNREKKLGLLRLSLLSNPRNEKTLYALHEWYYTVRDYRKAQYYLQQVLALNPKNGYYVKQSEKLNRLLAK
ncbi:MAG: tetratricopeptide repeat protein [Treponema sp.]